MEIEEKTEMHKNQFNLLTKRKFLPLFITQFLGAFNDNVLKTALVIMITYFVADKLAIPPQVLVTLTGGMLILPLFLFSANAGIVADKFDKARLIKNIKFIEMILMCLAAIGFWFQSVYFLMFVLFLMGTQSAYFGPLKYSILPTHLEDDELISGNGLIELGTFLSILLGNVLGVIVIKMPHAMEMTGGLLILVAGLGFFSSLFIPKAPPTAAALKLSLNFVKDTIDILGHTKKNRNIFLSILAISWFWLVGFTFLTQFPTYTKDYIGGSEPVFVFFLALFSIGIGVGSLLCNRLLKGRIEATFVPLAALGLSLFTFDLVWVSSNLEIESGAELLTTAQFLAKPIHWRIIVDLILVSLCGGIFVVPLYALIQHESEEEHKARTIAANNVMNAFFMTVATILTSVLLFLDFSVLQVFSIMAILNLIVMVKICRLLPGRLLKSMLRMPLGLLYNVEVEGIKHLEAVGNRAILTPNHTSFLDGALLAAFLPGRLTFAVFEGFVDKWWMKPVAWIVDIYGIQPTSPMALKSLIKVVQQDKICVIFPEGRITQTGALMKIYEGPGVISIQADAPIVPIRIDGAQYSPFSKLRKRVRIRMFPTIKITICEPVKFDVPEHLRSRRKRQFIAEKLYHVMTQMMFDSTRHDLTLFESVKKAKHIHGSNHVIADDINRRPLTYKRLVLGSYLIGKRFTKLSEEKEALGILLPNAVANVISFFACQATNRVAAMLNFTSGAANVISACETAKIKTIITSKKFIEQGKLENLIEALDSAKLNIKYLEDYQTEIKSWHKLQALFFYYMPIFWRHAKKHPNDPAVILFTSGSEGTPKAVVLSSCNLQSNINQLTSCIDFGPTDKVVNALPMFHSFGLTGGTLLPLLSGVNVFFYPTPLHFRIIPEVCYDTAATIFFGTNTFLTGYARFAHSYDFYSVRYVFCGAEKLKDETRKIWSEKFGVRLFEGYGATETAPVISTNTPTHNRSGTVGQFLPKIEYRLEDVPGIDEGGRLFVKGPNVMLGYMFHDNPGILVPPKEGWYDTGDIIALDEEGYITIKGRAKRFAKIAGEMVSLTAVEALVDALWPDKTNAVIAVPDEKKGEQLVLITTNQDATRDELVQFAKSKKVAELMIPKTIKLVDNIPLLGTGKIDYPGLNDMLNI